MKEEIQKIINEVNKDYVGVSASRSICEKIDVEFEFELRDDSTAKLQLTHILRDFNLKLFYAYDGLGGSLFELELKN